MNTLPPALPPTAPGPAAHPSPGRAGDAGRPFAPPTLRTAAAAARRWPAAGIYLLFTWSRCGNASRSTGCAPSWCCSSPTAPAAASAGRMPPPVDCSASTGSRLRAARPRRVHRRQVLGDSSLPDRGRRGDRRRALLDGRALHADVLLGLALVAIGTGFFKVNASTMDGQLYGRGIPPRRRVHKSSTWARYAGALFGQMASGYLGESPRWGWHYGFGGAGVGMLCGLALYLRFKRALPGRHRRPAWPRAAPSTGPRPAADAARSAIA